MMVMQCVMCRRSMLVHGDGVDDDDDAGGDDDDDVVPTQRFC